MNTLSWMLWLADISGKFSDIVGVGCGFASIVVIIMSIALLIAQEDMDEPIKVRLLKVRKILWPVIFVGFTLVILIPGKSTLHAIAASELGDMLINSKDMAEVKKEALTTIKAWLQKNR